MKAKELETKTDEIRRKLWAGEKLTKTEARIFAQSPYGTASDCRCRR